MPTSSPSSQFPSSSGPLLLLGSQMATGGAQRVLLDQARWFYDHGYPVKVAFFYDREGLHDQYLAECPCPVIDLKGLKKGGGWANGFRFIAALWKLFGLLRQERFQVVETFTHHANLIGMPIAWISGVPTRVASHHGQIDNLPSWMDWLHAQVINRGFTSVLVAVSERVRSQAILKEGIIAEKIVVIPNGIKPIKATPKRAPELISLKAELSLQTEDFLFLTVGRLATQKGHTYLFEAITKVVDLLPQVKFLLAGEGPLHADLEARVDALSIRKYIRFLGIRNDIPMLLSMCDGFVLPSLWEGLPIALLEAMSAGLPVIATDVEGVHEIIENKKNGLLVPPADPVALANAILELIKDRKIQNQIALTGKKLVEEKYSIDRMGSNYEKLFFSG